MNRKLLQLTLLLLVGFLLFPISALGQLKENLPPVVCQEKDERIAVMLLGSYHMSNPGLDSFNLKSDDVLKPKRQAELEKLSKRLAEFKPTKIAVEAPYGDEPTITRYREYAEGKREMRKSEEEQIGFRLAKNLNHKTVYPIDVRMGLNDSALKPIIGKNPKYQAKMGELQKLGQGAMAQMGKWLAEGTISDMLYNMNRQEMLRQAHWPYVWVFAPIADGNDYAGADMVATWYKRNLRIFANLNRMAEKGDRIFVVYGQGHIPILQDLVDGSPTFCRVDPLPYLEEK